MIDVLLVDDHPLLTLGLSEQLKGVGLTVEIGTLESDDELLDQVRNRLPRVVVLDYDLAPTRTGLVLIPQMTALGTTVVMLTGNTDESVLGACVSAGASAVIGKGEGLSTITNAIEAVVAGAAIRVGQSAMLAAQHERAQRTRSAELAPLMSLSRREAAILRSLMSGASPAEIARIDYVSVATVRSQVKSILRKLGVSSQLEAVAMAHRLGWTPTSPGSPDAAIDEQPDVG